MRNRETIHYLDPQSKTYDPLCRAIDDPDDRLAQDITTVNCHLCLLLYNEYRKERKQVKRGI